MCALKVRGVSQGGMAAVSPWAAGSAPSNPYFFVPWLQIPLELSPSHRSCLVLWLSLEFGYVTSHGCVQAPFHGCRDHHHLGCHLSCPHGWCLTQTILERAAPPVWPGWQEWHDRLSHTTDRAFPDSPARSQAAVGNVSKAAERICVIILWCHSRRWPFPLPVRQDEGSPCCAELPSISLSRVWGRIRPNVSGWDIHIQ